MAGTIKVVQLATRPPGAPATKNALVLQSGATSQQLFQKGEVHHGCVIANGLSATDQGGIAAAEEIWVDFTGAAAQASPGGTSFSIQPGQIFTWSGECPTSVNWIATTTNHKISAFSF